MKVNHQGISNPYEVIVITIFVSILFITGVYAWQWYVKEKTVASVVNRLQRERICPDEWIVNRFPGPGTGQPTEYFILDGQRRELNEFDILWVQRVCGLEKQEVY